tara:strand:- start:374 stop:595 length:222 start_codon:yes stop_codon:yes gene_type:complete
MGLIKWTAVILLFILVVYIEVLIINGFIKKREYKRTHFPCTYISGICTVKPTWDKCSGGAPLSYCEAKLNGKL